MKFFCKITLEKPEPGTLVGILFVCLFVLILFCYFARLADSMSQKSFSVSQNSRMLEFRHSHFNFLCGFWDPNSDFLVCSGKALITEAFLLPVKIFHSKYIHLYLCIFLFLYLTSFNFKSMSAIYLRDNGLTLALN